MHSPSSSPLNSPTPHRSSTSSGPKRGARVIKPKKPTLVAQQKIKHKSSAGLTAQTEKMLAQKAGHLEMLKGGKKDKGKEGEGKGKRKG